MEQDLSWWFNCKDYEDLWFWQQTMLNINKSYIFLQPAAILVYYYNDGCI